MALIEENTNGVSIKDTPKFIIWQVSIWDRYAKTSPLFLIAVVGILYYYGFRDWELLLDTLMIMGGMTFIVWWFWVIYTIAMIAYVIEKSRTGLEEVIKDIHAVRSDIRHIIKRRNK